MPAARATDPQTSHTAATIDPADLDVLRATILRTFNRRPKTGWTDDELVPVVQEKVSRTPQRIRTARKDLSKLGLIRDTDTKRRTVTGYHATVRALA